MSTSNEVVKAALSEGIRARQVVLDQHVENLVEIGPMNYTQNENYYNIFRFYTRNIMF